MSDEYDYEQMDKAIARQLREGQTFIVTIRDRLDEIDASDIRDGLCDWLHVEEEELGGQVEIEKISKTDRAGALHEGEKRITYKTEDVA